MTGEAQGSEDSIKSFLKELNKGPSAAHVVKVEKEDINTKVCIFSLLLRMIIRHFVRNGWLCILSRHFSNCQSLVRGSDADCEMR